MEKLNIEGIYDLLHVLHDVLGDEYNEEVTSGASLNDTIKVTKQGSTNAMYIGFDNEYPTVIDASVWNEDNFLPVAEGIYWDTEDEKLTPETIAADIEKEF